VIGTPITCGDWHGEVLRLRVRAQPRAGRLEVAGVRDGRLRLRLTAAPADGAANQQAKRLIAGAFGVGITRVSLATGGRHRDKVFLVKAPTRLPAGVLVT
jgi:uncharacterized protein YggU (UPF0235/DUF167 family)